MRRDIALAVFVALTLAGFSVWGTQSRDGSTDAPGAPGPGSRPAAGWGADSPSAEGFKPHSLSGKGRARRDSGTFSAEHSVAGMPVPTYAIVDLGTLGGAWSCAYGVNSAGDVVGVAGTAEGSKHAFV